MGRAWLLIAILMIIVGPAHVTAQTPAPPADGVLPVRVELGGYYSWVDRGFGDWKGMNASLWWRGSHRFVPGFLVDSQVRPTGTQQNYTFMSYMNWTDSFYTVQGVSGAPQRSDEAIYFPKIRYDIKGYWKLPPARNFVLAAGYTRFDFGSPGHGNIYNLGALYYHKKVVVEGNLFVNQSRPGDLWSGSGSVSLQYGMEGKYWFGLTAGGGRELYRVESLTPLEVRLISFSLDLFYRRWISRHVGYIFGASLQDKMDAYRRAGVSARMFFEF